jgi:hypothetical protein
LQGSWGQLQTDGTLLRVIAKKGLVSAGAEFFDQLLSGNCPADWTKSAAVVGRTMADALDSGHWINDSYLFWRVAERTASRQIQADGDPRKWAEVEWSQLPKVRRLS